MGERVLSQGIAPRNCAKELRQGIAPRELRARACCWIACPSAETRTDVRRARRSAAGCGGACSWSSAEAVADDTSEIVSSSACLRFGEPGDAERSEATLSAPSAEVGEETLAAAIITLSVAR